MKTNLKIKNLFVSKGVDFQYEAAQKDGTKKVFKNVTSGTLSKLPNDTNISFKASFIKHSKRGDREKLASGFNTIYVKSTIGDIKDLFVLREEKDVLINIEGEFTLFRHIFKKTGDDKSGVYEDFVDGKLPFENGSRYVTIRQTANATIDIVETDVQSSGGVSVDEVISHIANNKESFTKHRELFASLSKDQQSQLTTSVEFGNVDKLDYFAIKVGSGTTVNVKYAKDENGEFIKADGVSGRRLFTATTSNVPLIGLIALPKGKVDVDNIDTITLGKLKSALSLNEGDKTEVVRNNTISRLCTIKYELQFGDKEIVKLEKPSLIFTGFANNESADFTKFETFALSLNIPYIKNENSTVEKSEVKTDEFDEFFNGIDIE